MQKSKRVASLQKIMRDNTQRRNQRKRMALKIQGQHARRRQRNFEHEPTNAV